MPDHALFDTPEQSFPKLNKADWSRAASLEIQGKNPLEHLIWKSQDEINFLPYYDLQDIKSLDYLRNFETPPVLSHAGPRSWNNLPKVTVSRIEDANAVALNHLANGADGILFDLGQQESVNIDQLLADIDWSICNVSFLVTPSPTLIQSIKNHVSKKNYDPGLLSGALFCNSAPGEVISHLNNFRAFTLFRSWGIRISSHSPVAAISNALVQVVALLDACSSPQEKEFAWRNISLSLAAGTEFFLEIAKLKAARLLLFQIAQAFDLSNYSEVEIHVSVDPWVNEKFQPNSNMLNGTCAALSAIVGGCNSLTILPEDEFNSTSNRIARNVSNILREEAHINKVSDPLAGSYAIENIVDSLAKAVWKDFQQNVRQA